MFKRPINGPSDGIYWFVLQTYSAARIAFRRYRKFAGPLVIDKNESQLVCTLQNGAQIFFKSGNNFEDLRAETLHGCVIDEYRQQNPDLWSLVIRPMLARKKGWCDFLSTTNGLEHFYDVWGEAEENKKEWGTFHAPSTEAWWWTPEEIASARNTMTDDEFAQEIEAEFREFGKGKVYLKHGTHNQSTQNPLTVIGLKWNPFLPIIIGLDFNVGLMCWCLMQYRGGDFYVGDEIAVPNTNTEECAPVLIDKIKDHKPGVMLIGDASGNSDKTSASGKTDYSILMKMLKEAKIEVRNKTPEGNPHIKDRVNMVNSRLRAADRSVHLWYHPVNCKTLKKDFERVTWKEGTNGALLEGKKDPLLTHMSDAVGYPICVLSEEWRVRPGKIHVINR